MKAVAAGRTRQQPKRPAPASGDGPQRARGRQRQRRVGEALRHALAAILNTGECRDPVLADASVTVTEVRVSPDLREATAFVTPLGGMRAPEVLGALERSSGFLRRRLARDVPLRFMPRLVFALDPSFDAAARISHLLASPEVARDLGPRAEAGES